MLLLRLLDLWAAQLQIIHRCIWAQKTKSLPTTSLLCAAFLSLATFGLALRYIFEWWTRVMLCRSTSLRSYLPVSWLPCIGVTDTPRSFLPLR